MANVDTATASEPSESVKDLNVRMSDDMVKSATYLR